MHNISHTQTQHKTCKKTLRENIMGKPIVNVVVVVAEKHLNEGPQKI